MDVYTFPLMRMYFYRAIATVYDEHYLESKTSSQVFFNGTFRPPFLPVRNLPEFQNCVGAGNGCDRFLLTLQGTNIAPENCWLEALEDDPFLLGTYW